MKVMIVSTPMMTVLSSLCPPGLQRRHFNSKWVINVICYPPDHLFHLQAQPISNLPGLEDFWEHLITIRWPWLWLEGEDAALVIQTEHAQGEGDQVESHTYILYRKTERQGDHSKSIQRATQMNNQLLKTVGEWVNTSGISIQCIHCTLYMEYSALKRNELPSHEEIRKTLKCILLSERS